MRRTLHFLVAVVLTLTCSIGATAYASAPPRVTTYAKQGEATTVVPSRCNPLGKDVKPQSGLKDVPADARKSFKTRKVARAITVDQLVGKYAIHYKSLSTSYLEGGGSVYITKKSADSITVHDFFYQGITFTAHVDVDHGTFDIPVQVIGTNESYGDVALCKMNSDGSPNYKTPITGTITSDGSLDIDGWWGIYVTSGTYVNRYIYPGYATTIDKANGTMKVRRVYVSDSDTVDERWNVVLKQKSANLVTVQNFGNHGLTLEVVLGSDGTATVDKQVAIYETTEYGNFYPVMVDDWSKEKYTFSSPLVGRATQDSINFGNWTLASDMGFYDNKLLYGYITGIKFVLPEPASSSLQGSGTESDPYLVNSLADLIYVS